jgi:hypothetical protein
MLTHPLDECAESSGFNAYDITKLMGHASVTTSQPYIRNLPVGAGEAVLLKNQRVTIPSQVKLR